MLVIITTRVRRCYHSRVRPDEIHASTKFAVKRIFRLPQNMKTKTVTYTRSYYRKHVKHFFLSHCTFVPSCF